jgi:hypothetical protein
MALVNNIPLEKIRAAKREILSAINPPPAQAHFSEKAPRGAGAPPGGTPSQSQPRGLPPRAPWGAGKKTKSQGRPGNEVFIVKEP